MNKCKVCGNWCSDNATYCVTCVPRGRKEIMADGKLYKSLQACMDELETSRQAITYRLKSGSDKFKNWYYVNEDGGGDLNE